MVGIPGRFGGGHLYDAAAHAPDVAGPAVVVAPQHLRGHEGDGAQQLPLELPRYGGLVGQAGRRAEVPDAEPVPGTVYQQVSTCKVLFVRFVEIGFSIYLL